LGDKTGSVDAFSIELEEQHIENVKSVSPAVEELQKDVEESVEKLHVDEIMLSTSMTKEENNMHEIPRPDDMEKVQVTQISNSKKTILDESNTTIKTEKIVDERSLAANEDNNSNLVDSEAGNVVVTQKHSVFSKKRKKKRKQKSSNTKKKIIKGKASLRQSVVGSDAILDNEIEKLKSFISTSVDGNENHSQLHMKVDEMASSLRSNWMEKDSNLQYQVEKLKLKLAKKTKGEDKKFKKQKKEIDDRKKMKKVDLTLEKEKYFRDAKLNHEVKKLKKSINSLKYEGEHEELHSRIEDMTSSITNKWAEKDEELKHQMDKLKLHVDLDQQIKALKMKLAKGTTNNDKVENGVKKEVNEKMKKRRVKSNSKEKAKKVAKKRKKGKKKKSSPRPPSETDHLNNLPTETVNFTWE